jgi:hypothetical protein
MPDATVTFPYGTAQSPISVAKTKQALAKSIVVQLGQADTDPNSANLRHTTQADVQGLNRLARGRYFYNQSFGIAQNLNTAFGWSISEVPGVGHSHTLMAAAAVPFVITALEPYIHFPADKAKTFCHDGKLYFQYLNDGDTLGLEWFSLTGQKISQDQVMYQSGASYAIPEPNGRALLLRLTVNGRFTTPKVILSQ